MDGLTIFWQVIFDLGLANFLVNVLRPLFAVAAWLLIT